jgi:hypothetical protein
VSAVKRNWALLSVLNFSFLQEKNKIIMMVIKDALNGNFLILLYYFNADY